MLRSLDDLDHLEKLALFDMSYSRMNTYLECEARYFYSYITKDKRVFGAPAALGNVVHEVLEHADLNEMDLDAMLGEAWEEARAIHDPEGKIDEQLLEVGKEILTDFVDRHTGEAFHDVGRELSFEVVIGSGLFRGFIDRVDHLPDGSVAICDYKTGKYPPPQKWAHRNLQLGLYALVSQYLWPDKWPIKGYLYFLRTGKLIHHTYTQEDLDWVEQEIIRVTQEIIEKNNFGYTKNTRQCFYCDHSQNGACPRGKTVTGRW